MRRNYMATINFDQNGESPLRFLPDWEKIRRIKQVTFQLEMGDEEHRLHWQVFMEFTDGVSIINIQDDVKAQGKHIAVKEPKQDSLHPKAGRNYVTKGTPIDKHRYFWSKAQGYIGAKPIIPVEWVQEDYETYRRKLRQMEFSKETIKGWLAYNIEECSKYVLGKNKKCEYVKKI